MRCSRAAAYRIPRPFPVLIPPLSRPSPTVLPHRSFPAPCHCEPAPQRWCGNPSPVLFPVLFLSLSRPFPVRPRPFCRTAAPPLCHCEPAPQRWCGNPSPRPFSVLFPSFFRPFPVRPHPPSFPRLPRGLRFAPDRIILWTKRAPASRRRDAARGPYIGSDERGLFQTAAAQRRQKKKRTYMRSSGRPGSALPGSEGGVTGCPSRYSSSRTGP